LLVAILSAGGWYFTKNPGKLTEFLASLKQSQAGATQNAPGGYLPQTSGYQPFPTQQAPVPTQANYSGQPITPRPAPPTPMSGGPAIRIATFNIQIFGDDKASKPYVMATLGSIIQNFHLVAIQEIRTKDPYFIDKFLSTYVNNTGRKYDKVVGPRLGRSVSKEQYAFIYDTAAIEVNPESIFTVNDPDDLLQREPLIAQFRVRGPPPEQAFTFELINIHTEPDDTKNELNALAKVYQAVRRASNGEDDVILLGDLNVDDRHLGDLGKIDGIMPIVQHKFTNTRQNAQFDNIIIHRPSTTEFTGKFDVFNFAQAYHLSPEQALLVSDHFPVWAEFNAYESMTPVRVAARDNTGVRQQ
jgi:endonuclease/exonuclease/phosphatase family metal-dependent hydrolase